MNGALHVVHTHETSPAGIFLADLTKPGVDEIKLGRSSGVVLEVEDSSPALARLSAPASPFEAPKGLRAADLPGPAYKTFGMFECGLGIGVLEQSRLVFSRILAI